MQAQSPNPQQNAASPEEALQALITDPDFERLEALLTEFNPFDVLGVARSELRHSRTIAWLLNPRGSHGLRDYFLRGFLSQAATEARERGITNVPFTPTDIDGWKFSDVEVARERHDIDILLTSESDGFICPIENKVGSDEHSNQLSRYLQTVESEYTGLAPFPIYITPDGRKPQQKQDAERWTPFSYEKVADLITQISEARRSTISASVANFLEQYDQTIRRRIVNTLSDIDKLALQIYIDHSEAIDLIIKARPSSASAMYWDIIEPAIERYAPDLKPDYHTRTMRRLFVPQLDDIPDINKGERWTDSGRMVLFEFKCWGRDNMEIWLTVGPGPQETHERLLQLAMQYGRPFFSSPKQSGDWFYIYKKPILDRQDFNPFDPDKARPKIEKAIKDFYDADYWPLVKAIRKEFGLSPVSPN